MFTNTKEVSEYIESIYRNTISNLQIKLDKYTTENPHDVEEYLYTEAYLVAASMLSSLANNIDGGSYEINYLLKNEEVPFNSLTPDKITNAITLYGEDLLDFVVNGLPLTTARTNVLVLLLAILIENSGDSPIAHKEVLTSLYPESMYDVYKILNLPEGVEVASITGESIKPALYKLLTPLNLTMGFYDNKSKLRTLFLDTLEEISMYNLKELLELEIELFPMVETPEVIYKGAYLFRNTKDKSALTYLTYRHKIQQIAEDVIDYTLQRPLDGIACIGLTHLVNKYPTYDIRKYQKEDEFLADVYTLSRKEVDHLITRIGTYDDRRYEDLVRELISM